MKHKDIYIISRHVYIFRLLLRDLHLKPKTNSTSFRLNDCVFEFDILEAITCWPCAFIMFPLCTQDVLRRCNIL